MDLINLQVKAKEDLEAGSSWTQEVNMDSGVQGGDELRLEEILPRSCDKLRGQKFTRQTLQRRWQ